jgi:hypothetical protein
MANDNGEKVIYGINVNDVQEVSAQILDRPLTDAELALVENSIGDHIDWFAAIESAIESKIMPKIETKIS